MGKVSQSTFRNEDFSEAPEWFKDKAINLLNEIFKSIRETVNGELVFGDNIKIIDKEINLSTNILPYKIQNNEKPTQVILLGMNRDVDGGHNVITGIGGIDWTYENGNIVLYAITGLTADNSKVRIRII
jgi:hypothetical protein